LLLLGALVAACVSASRPNALDFSSLKTFDVEGFKLKLPSYFKQFEESGAALFRSEPPVRPSPGVLVKRDAGAKASTALQQAAYKIQTQMGGAPLAVRGKVGGKDAVGLQDQLMTHFIWIYVVEAAGAAWTVQIIAPVEWTDEQALAFHDLVCQNARWPD
jgi:hypothetical protein